MESVFFLALSFVGAGTLKRDAYYQRASHTITYGSGIEVLKREVFPSNRFSRMLACCNASILIIYFLCDTVRSVLINLLMNFPIAHISY